MSDRIHQALQAGLIAAMAVLGLWAWQQLPPGSSVPVHFNAAGEVDRWAAPSLGLFFLPLLALAMLGLRYLLPHVDPRGANLLKSARALGAIWTALLLMLTLLQFHLVLRALGLAQAEPQLPLLLIGGLLIAIGNVLGKLRSNFTVGIRTPWTLANERVWDQTHRFGGKVFVLGGALLVALAFSPLPQSWRSPLIVIVTLAAAASSTLKSYWLWRQLDR